MRDREVSRVVCMDCRVTVSGDPDAAPVETSHGLCVPCYRVRMEELDRMDARNAEGSLRLLASLRPARQDDGRPLPWRAWADAAAGYVLRAAFVVGVVVVGVVAVGALAVMGLMFMRDHGCFR